MKTIKITFLFLVFTFCAAPLFSQQKSTQELNEKMAKALEGLSPEQLNLVLQQATTLVDKKDSKKVIAQVMNMLSPEQKQDLLNFAVMEKYGLNEKPKTPVAAAPKKRTMPQKVPRAKAQPRTPKAPKTAAPTPPKVHDHSDDHSGHAHAKAAEPAAPVGPTTTIKFEESEFDFGVIESGEKISHVYKFTNTGTEPLIIKNAKGSCGCTVPKWPKGAIAPGETGEMLVEFNSRGKSGVQNKRVTITANTNPAQTYINIKGEILKKENNKQ